MENSSKNSIIKTITWKRLSHFREVAVGKENVPKNKISEHFNDRILTILTSSLCLDNYPP